MRTYNVPASPAPRSRACTDFVLVEAERAAGHSTKIYAVVEA
jgi:hypothetical protein